MNKHELQEKYPEHQVKYEPLENCPRCHGTGEYINGLNKTGLCFCTCIEFSREYPEFFNDALNATAKRGKENLKARKNDY